MSANLKGKAPRPKSSASKPTKASIAPGSSAKPPKRSGYRTERAVRRSTFSSVDSWDTKSSGRWHGGRATTLNPGSESSITRRKNNPNRTARTKKVIRPRIQKISKADK